MRVFYLLYLPLTIEAATQNVILVVLLGFAEGNRQESKIAIDYC